MKKLILLLVVSMLLIYCAKNDNNTGTPPPDPIDMNQVLEDFIAANPNVPSVSMAAVKDGEIFYSYGTGFYDDEGTRTPDENTLYVTSSMAKLVVAVAIMQQVEQGMLDIDDDVSNYIGFQVRNPNFPASVITTRMLMQHAASLANPVFGEAVDAIFFGYEPDSIIQLHPLIEDIITPGSAVYMETIWMNVAPGTLHKNSNYGITMLGYLVEQLSGQHFNDYTKTNIFEPLGMDASSYYYPDLNPDNIAAIYSSTTGDLLTPFSYWFYPAGMLYTSRGDWPKFMMAILNGGSFNGNQILQSSSVNAMLDTMEPANNQLAYNSNIGLVWREAPVNAGWIGHTGAGWVTHITEINPEKNMGYVVFTNEGSIGESLVGPGGSLNTTIHKWLHEQME